MISDSEFRRLQKLASLSFSGDEEKKFIAQISNTINFLDQLKELDNILPKQNSISVDNPLRVIN
jgi:aspartyl/glutamyl-tRNA(Asn/Gln) amidotransferase C subunit